MIKLLLTSKRKYPVLEKFCRENNIELQQISFLKIESLKPVFNLDLDWLFFSSPNAVKAFLQANYNYQGKLACIGNSTAKPFKANNINPDYIGDVTQGPDAIAKAFLEISKGQSVIHLTSNLTSSVLNRNSTEEIPEVEIYRTYILPQRIEPFDLAIVTSPSNLVGLYNSVDSLSQTLIAQGPTTFSSMKSKGLRQVMEAKTPNEEGWIETIKRSGIISN